MGTATALAARMRMVTAATVATALATIAACQSEKPAEPAKQCVDPCCSGNPEGIDCATSPNLSCAQDADPCTDMTYGCNSGTYYKMGPSQTPARCHGDGSTVSLKLGDAMLVGTDDAGNPSGE